MVGYKKCNELGSKLNQCMEHIKTLDYGVYSIRNITKEEIEIYHAVSNMIQWQEDIKKTVDIVGSGLNKKIIIGMLQDDMNDLSFFIEEEK